MVADVVESICTVPSPDTDCEPASAACLLEFAGAGSGIPEFDVQPKKPDSLFTPIIVSKDPTQLLGVINTNDIVPEFIIGDDALLPQERISDRDLEVEAGNERFEREIEEYIARKERDDRDANGAVDFRDCHIITAAGE